jgi:hypothetical protein
MDRGFFDTILRRINRATRERVARSLRIPGKRQQQARAIAEVVLTAKSESMAGGELLIPTAYWRSEINNLYLWHDLSRATSALKDIASSYDGLSLVVCFASVSRSGIKVLQGVEPAALSLVTSIDTQDAWSQGIADIADFSPSLHELEPAPGNEQLEIGLKSSAILFKTKKEGHRWADQDAPIVCNMAMVRDRAYRSSREYGLYTVDHFCPRHFRPYEGLFVSLTVRSRVRSNVPMKVRLNFDFKNLRETREKDITSDEFGFFDYRDYVENLTFDREGILEVAPFFDSVPLKARLYLVQKSCTFRASEE